MLMFLPKNINFFLNTHLINLLSHPLLHEKNGRTSKCHHGIHFQCLSSNGAFDQLSCELLISLSHVLGLFLPWVFALLVVVSQWTLAIFCAIAYRPWKGLERWILSSHSIFVLSHDESTYVSKTSLLHSIMFSISHGIHNRTLSPIQSPMCG